MLATEYSEDYEEPLPFCPLAVRTSSLHSTSSRRTNLCFSEAAVKILNQYRQAFPDLFARIRDFDTSDSMMDLVNRESDLKAVTHFVEELPFHNDVMADIGTTCCLEKHADLLQQTSTVVGNMDDNCDVHITCSPDLVAFWERTRVDESVSDALKIIPMIGNRVVIIGGNDIPFGSRGYVVAVHPKWHVVEVVMDKPFIGGSNLYGLLQVKGRGG